MVKLPMILESFHFLTKTNEKPRIEVQQKATVFNVKAWECSDSSEHRSLP